MNKSKKEKLDELIEQGKHVKKVNFVKVTEPGLAISDYISGEEYDIWMNNVKIYASKYCRNHTLYDDIMNTYKRRKNSWGTDAFDDVMSYLIALRNDDDFINNNHSDKIDNTLGRDVKADKMIFISHSSLDIDYVNLLVELLEDIGFKGRSMIFCSSVSGYGIPMGKRIYDYLKEQFNKELYVIYLLSENYYNSPACLNEMGATWVKSKRHTAILTPEFNYSQIKGAIDASRIWIKINDKDKITELKDELLGEFGLDDIETSYWERKREKFLTNVFKIYENNKHKTSLQKIEFEGIEDNLYDEGYKCFFRFINKDDVPKRCLYIKLLVEDKNEGKIEITLTNSELSNLIVYNYENKRVELDIGMHNFEIFSEFTSYLWDRYEIVDSRWTKVL